MVAGSEPATEIITEQVTVLSTEEITIPVTEPVFVPVTQQTELGNFETLLVVLAHRKIDETRNAIFYNHLMTPTLT